MLTGQDAGKAWRQHAVSPGDASRFLTVTEEEKLPDGNEADGMHLDEPTDP
jgi:hypothetical protein